VFSFFILVIFPGMAGGVRIKRNVTARGTGIPYDWFLAVGAFSVIMPSHEMSPRIRNPSRIEPSTTTNT
jgi:hypothetical protein